MIFQNEEAQLLDVYSWIENLERSFQMDPMLVRDQEDSKDDVESCTKSE